MMNIKLNLCYLFFIIISVSVYVNAESAAEHVLEVYDADMDGLLSVVEFENYFFAIFPNLKEEEHDEHDEAHDEHDEETHGEETHGEGEVHAHGECEDVHMLFEELAGSEDGFLNETQVASAIDVVMIMLVEKCDEVELHHEDEVLSPDCEPTELWLSWIYGIGTTIVICCLSLVGVILIPLKGSTKEVVMRAFIGLAIGALIGDAILHILPRVFGAHSHNTGNATVYATHLEEALDTYILPGVVCVASIVVFYLIEILTEHLTGGHNHNMLGQNSDSDSADQKLPKEEIENVGYMIIVLDAIHNFVDGLALGTAFITSPVVGFATALAIILHELPQELGDFAVLIWAGFTRNQALGYNLLSSLTAIIGTIVGLIVGDTIHTADKWILATVAGSFLYIALGELLPHLAHSKSSGSKIPEVILMGVGLGLMVALSFIELALEVECGSHDGHAADVHNH